MKLSDFVFKFIKEKTTDSVFLISGGHIMHLVDSLGKSGINYYCCHHEQGAVMAADGYARIKNQVGVALITLPGVPNAVTGITAAWLDSIPLLVISGQVKHEHMMPRKNGRPIIRQVGFQEVDAMGLVAPITKYAVSMSDPQEIKYHLARAVYSATHGRPGPVWIEIPLDIQEAEVDENNLTDFTIDEFKENNPLIKEEAIKEIAALLRQAKKPLLMAGNGISLAGGEPALNKFLEKTKIKAVTPMFTGSTVVTYDYPNYLGRQGMPGNRSANYAIDNCDLLLIIGERMQITQLSYDYQNFAVQAKKIMVDIDAAELNKKTLKIDVPVQADAKLFLEKLTEQDLVLNNWQIENETINPDDYAVDGKYLNVYKFLDKLGESAKDLDIVTANGMASTAAHQALRVYPGNKFLTNAGHGNMGSGLPMAIGACIARGKRPVICLEGDGSLMMNIQELQTVIHHQLPIKIFIYNNNGYYSIKCTHSSCFKKVYAANPDNGVTLPDYSKLIPAWGLAYERINNDQELSKLEKVMAYSGPIVCELMLDPDQPMPEKWTAGKYKEN